MFKIFKCRIIELRLVIVRCISGSSGSQRQICDVMLLYFVLCLTYLNKNVNNFLINNIN